MSDADYYLSCYLSPPGGLPAFTLRHDQGIALWARTRDTVELVRFWEFERISGQKHHYWPVFTGERARQLIAGLLAEEGLLWSDITVTWGTPGLPSYQPIKIPYAGEQFPVHSLAHLFSGMVLDSELFKRETIVALAMDSGPDFALDETTKPFWYAGCVAQAGEIVYSAVESPAPLYDACRNIFGLEEGTLMALASACDTYVDAPSAAAVKDVKLYGGRDHPTEPATALVRSITADVERQLNGSSPDPRFSAEDNLRSAVMKVVQQCCQEIAVRNIERLCSSAGIDPERCYLSLTGGFALNCPSNTFLLDHFGFQGLLTPPCPNDSGQPLGLGLLAMHGAGLLDDVEFRLGSAYHGSKHLALDSALGEFAPWIESVSDFDDQNFIADIERAPVAWVHDCAEIGPRALGHRSLLADPRSTTSKDALNRLKGRQWWRPVAPVVLEERLDDWFETNRPSPYMLETAQIRPDRLAQVPAVAHLDGSARFQSITRAVDQHLYDAVQAFGSHSGIPMLCNTSLNDKGEPIVGSAADALNFCLRKGVDVAYIGGKRVALRRSDEVAQPGPDQPRRRMVEPFAGQEEDRDRIWAQAIDRGYSVEAVYLATRSPELCRDGAFVESPRHVDRLVRMIVGANPRFANAVRRFVRSYGPGSRFAVDARLPNLDE